MLWYNVSDVEGGVSLVTTGGERVTCAMQMSQLSERKAPAQRLCGLKMADGENSLKTALSGASDTGEPPAKISKISPGTNYGLKAVEADQFSCVSAATESWEAALNCAQPAEKEAKPVMAVEQAPAALGGDNNGLEVLLSDPHKPVGKLDDTTVFGATEDSPGIKREKNFEYLSDLQ